MSSRRIEGQKQEICDSYCEVVSIFATDRGCKDHRSPDFAIWDIVGGKLSSGLPCARSKAEFIAKIGIVVEEADETAFWLELLVDTDIVPETRMRSLMKEANELLAIFAASQFTARRRRANRGQ